MVIQIRSLRRGLSWVAASLVVIAGSGCGRGDVTIPLAPVASVLLSPRTATIGLGSTLQLTATPRDSANSVITGRTATWGTSAPGVATVSDAGLVTGVAPGSAVIRATIDDRFAESTITVSTNPSPTIASVSPAVLTPGITATITGSNFAGATTGNVVSIDDLLATVTAASSTQLTIVVPATLPCTPSHPGRVQVVVQDLSVTTLQPVRVGTPVALGDNTPRLLSPGEAACAELPSGAGHYVVSVVDMNSTPTSTASFRLAGALPPSTTAALRAAPATLRQSIATPRATATSSLAEIGQFPRGTPVDVASRLHANILESNRATYARLRGATRAARLRASRSVAPSGVHRAVVPAVGEVRKFRVAQFSTAVNAAGSCSDFKEVSARAVYVGTRSVIYEDVAAPLAGTMDQYFRNLGQEFDASMYVSDSTYFGDPLVTDQSTDNDQHLSMVFTPSITEGVAGFVNSCDFFPRDSSGTDNDDRESNFGEYFYAIVPTDAGTGFKGAFTADQWLREIRSVIVHEVKHIASFGARFVNNASVFEEAWLEEGMALQAEEVWSRAYIYNAPWKGDATYRATVYCDVRPTVSECTGKPFSMFGHFATLYTWLDTPGAYSLFGRVSDGDFNFYAASWSLVRYSLDRYATSEASFLRGITQSTTTSGLQSISGQTGGHSPTELVTNWSLTMYLDDATANPDLNVATWDTHDIYAGMNRDFPTQSFTKAFPLVPTALSTPTFSVDNAGIHGGSFAMFTVPANAAGASTLSLAASGGTGPASADLRVSVVRSP